MPVVVTTNNDIGQILLEMKGENCEAYTRRMVLVPYIIESFNKLHSFFHDEFNIYT